MDPAVVTQCHIAVLDGVITLEDSRDMQRYMAIPKAERKALFTFTEHLHFASLISSVMQHTIRNMRKEQANA